MMLKVQGYNIIVKYVPGRKMFISDFLSRAPLSITDSEDFKLDLECDIEICHVSALINCLPISKEKYQLIKQKTTEDPTVTKVLGYIKENCPESKKQVDPQVKPFWNIRHELTAVDDIILKNELIVIPSCLRKLMLSYLHEGHSGIQAAVKRAKSAIFWPGMLSEIKEMCQNCQMCAMYASNKTKEPIIFHNIPNLPWVKIGTDLFEFNKSYYIVVVDYCSKFIEVSKLEDTKAKN